MAYTSLTTYFTNLNNIDKIIKRYSIHINLLHKILLNYKEFQYLLKTKIDFKTMLDKLMCIITVLLWKSPC